MENQKGLSHDHLARLLKEHNISLDHLKTDNHNHKHGREDQEPHHHENSVMTMSYCPLFKNMSQAEHDQFLDRNVKEVLTFKKGETIAMQGDPITTVMLLVQGSIRTEMITMEGNILDIDIMEAVTPLVPSFIYGEKNRFPVDIIAVEPSIFLKISKEAWLNEMANNKQMLTNFLTLNADLTLNLINKLQMISLKSLRKKLATFFLEKTTAENNSFNLKRSRTQLAEFFGVQRQSLSRSLKEMEDDSIIKLKGRNVNIIDRNKLIRE